MPRAGYQRDLELLLWASWCKVFLWQLLLGIKRTKASLAEFPQTSIKEAVTYHETTARSMTATSAGAGGEHQGLSASTEGRRTANQEQGGGDRAATAKQGAEQKKIKLSA
ncbi:hypothetical protein Droror1_Dr00017385 [Drosera rotundifolia]